MTRARVTDDGRAPTHGARPKPLVPEVASALSPLVRRIVCNNPGMMTGPGTNTYLVGVDEIVVVDPGPDDAAHLDAIAGCGGDAIRWIVCTHTHPDHSPGAAGLKARTGAEVLAFDDAGRAGDRPGHGRRRRHRGHRVPPHAPSTRPATRRTTCASCWRRSGCCSRATTSWAGRPWSSARPTATWRRTSRRSSGCGRCVRRCGRSPRPTATSSSDPAAKIDEYLAHRRAREAQVLDALRAAGSGRNRHRGAGRGHLHRRARARCTRWPAGRCGPTSASSATRAVPRGDPTIPTIPGSRLTVGRRRLTRAWSGRRG